MAEGNWPLAMETPRVGAARSQVMGDALYGRKVRRLLIET